MRMYKRNAILQALSKGLSYQANTGSTSPGATSRFWRVIATDLVWNSQGNSNYTMGLYGISLWESSDRSGPDLALSSAGGVASASSIYNGGGSTLSGINDGNLSTYWCSGLTAVSYQWAQITLPVAKSINSARVTWLDPTRTKCFPKTFDLQYSPDEGVSWITAASASIPNLAPDAYSVNLLGGPSGMGYAVGGSLNGSATSTQISALNFATDVAAALSRSLSVAVMYPAGASSPIKGYSAGSFDPTLSRISSLAYSNETLADPIAASLTTPRSDMGGTQSTTKSYFAGGNSASSVVQNKIDALTFASETVANAASALAQARLRLGCIQSAAKAYFCGGFNAPYTNLTSISGMNLTTEAYTAVSQVLSAARNGLMGLSAPTKGYLTGPYNSTGPSVYDSLDFSTEATATVNVTVATSGLGSGVQSTAKGYVMGGTTPTGSITEIRALDFKTEIGSVLSSVLTGRLYGSASLSHAT